VRDSQPVMQEGNGCLRKGRSPRGGLSARRHAPERAERRRAAVHIGGALVRGHHQLPSHFTTPFSPHIIIEYGAPHRMQIDTSTDISNIYKNQQTYTNIYKHIQKSTNIYKHLQKIYNNRQKSTNIHKNMQTCTTMYKIIQTSTNTHIIYTTTNKNL